MKVKCRYCHGHVYYDPKTTHDWKYRCDVCHTCFPKYEYLKMQENKKMTNFCSKCNNNFHESSLITYDEKLYCQPCFDKFKEEQRSKTCSHADIQQHISYDGSTKYFCRNCPLVMRLIDVEKLVSLGSVLHKKIPSIEDCAIKPKGIHCSHADVFLFYDPLTDFRFKCVYCAEGFTDLQMSGMMATGTVVHEKNPKLHPETSRPKVKREIANPIGKEKEALAVVEAFRLSFNLGNALLFLLSDSSGLQKISDLEKSIYYINREIEKT